MKRSWIVPVLVSGLLLLTSCSSTASKLVIPDDGPGAVCGPVNGNGEIFFGVDLLRNDGSKTAEVKSVELIDSKNLKVQSFGVLENDKEGDRGILHVPAAALSPDRDIPVGKEAVVQVALQLNDPAESGSAKSLKVTYGDTDTNTRNSITTVFSLTALPNDQECELDPADSA